MGEEILTVLEVARLFKVTDKHIYNMTKRGELKSFRFGKRVLYRRREIDEYIDRQLAATERAVTEQQL